MIDHPYRRQVFTSPIKKPCRFGIGPELGRCLSQRDGSGMILTGYGICIPAVDAAGPRNDTFDGGLLRLVFIDL